MRAMIVSRKVAVNPVARAVMMDNFRKTLRDAKIKMFMMDDGEDCSDVITNLGMTLAVVGYAAELEPDLGREFPQVRVLKGGLSALHNMQENNKWRRMDAMAVAQAVDAAEKLNKLISVDALSKAWIQLNRSDL